MKYLMMFLCFFVALSNSSANRGKEALEDFELNQLRILAISKNAECRFASIIDSNDKGHIIHIGSYIGKNNGKVIEINDSFIKILELVKDKKSTWIEREMILKISLK
jgi:type IV pilus assembly protein PilP